jgi:parallel beta-helix repeat protein
MKKVLSIFLGILIVCSGLFCLLFTGTENVSAQTYVSGNITTSTKWTTTGSPYIIQSDVKVKSGATLTIDPGVTVKFDGLYSLVIDGKLKAVGTKINPIKFTSNFSSPKKGDWYTIRLRTSNNVINWAEIDYAKYGVFVTYYGGNNKILNTTVNDCSIDGIYITNSDNNIVKNCDITSNKGYGMTLYESDNTIVENCNINNNIYFGIYFNASTYTQVKNCNISNINGKGIILYSNSHHTKIEDSIISYNTNIGIDLSGTSHNEITNTNIISNSGIGIDFGGETMNQSLENCIIANNNDTGLDLRGGDHIKIIKCYINGNAGNGIYSKGSTNYISISKSNISSNGYGGIYLEESTKTITYINVSDTTIMTNSGDGIYFFSKTSYCTLGNLTISDNSGNGIRFYLDNRPDYSSSASISYNIITQCKIFNNNQNGIFIKTYYYYPKINNNNINNNSIYLNNQNGIYFENDLYGYSMDNIIDTNEIYLNKGNGIILTSKRDSSAHDNYIRNCDIHQNELNGIYFYAYSWSTLFRNNIISSNIHRNKQNGIYMEAEYGKQTNVSRNNIIGCNVSHNEYDGIFFFAHKSAISFNNHIVDSEILGNFDFGIHLHTSNSNIITKSDILINMKDGIRSMYSSSTSLSYNSISYNNWNGVNLTLSSTNNYFSNNLMESNNYCGIFITSGSNNNLMIKNDFTNNSIVGLNVTNTKGNKIHHNNFKWNTINGFDSTISLNNWDDGAQGNYWSDYTGTDDNKDGFGEDPYVVPGGGSRDWHPFIEFLNFTPPKIQSVSPVNNSLNVPINTKFSIQFSKQMNASRVESAISISGEISPVNFSWTNGNKTVYFDPSSNLEYNSTYYVTVSTIAQDADGNAILYLYRWNFKTEPKPTPPTILSHSPTGIDVSVDTTIKVTFSELMDTNSVQGAFSIAPSATGTYSWNSATLTFTPNSALNYNTLYKVTIGTGAKDLENEFLAAAYSWQFTTVAAKTPTPPTVIDKSPIGDDVPVDTTITITFSESMNAGSVEGAYSISPSVAGTFNWNGPKIIFTPNNDLNHNTQYTVSVGTIAKDLENEFLASKFVWQFKTTVITHDPTPPTIIAHSPTGINVPVDAKVTVTFSELMNTQSVEYAFSIQPSVLGTFSWSEAKLIFTPNQDLKYKTQYTISISTSAKDLNNEFLESKFTWQFTTTSPIIPEPSSPPTIIDNSPTGTDVPVDSEITVTFSELMAAESVENAFAISPMVPGTFTWSEEKLIYTPENDLNYDTEYKVTISTAAKDLEDENLELEFSWLFTTISELIDKPLTPPAIIDNSPTGFEVPVESKITVTFSESMDKETTEDAFSISPLTDGVFSWENTILIFSPNEALEHDTEYTITINTKAKDLEDLNLESIFSWKFTTVVLESSDQYLDGILLSNTDLEVEVGDSHQFKPIAVDADGNMLNDQEFNYLVEGDIGKIDESGVFIAEKAGTGAVIISSQGKSVRATIKVIDEIDNETGELDTDTKSPDKKNTDTELFIYWIIGIIIVVVIIFYSIFMLKYKKRKMNKDDGSD